MVEENTFKYTLKNNKICVYVADVHTCDMFSVHSFNIFLVPGDTAI